MTEAPRAPAETLEGGCHCLRVRFRVRIEGPRKALLCNCSICDKKAFVHLIVEGNAFELLAGAEHLAHYRFNTGTADHLFCKVCGMHPFYRPRSHPEGWDVNVRCLDDAPLDTFRIETFDGRNWEANVGSIR